MNRRPRELVTLTAAAQRLDVPRRTVRGWVDRELLHPVGLGVDGTALFDLAAVRVLADSTPRRRPKRVPR